MTEGLEFTRVLVEAAADWCGVKAETVWGRGTSWAAADARHAVWHALRQRGWTNRRIGALFGRDHSTVSNGIAKAERRLSLGDPATRALLAQVERTALDPSIPPMGVEGSEAWLRAHIAAMDVEIAAAVAARERLAGLLQQVTLERDSHEAVTRFA